MRRCYVSAIYMVPRDCFIKQRRWVVGIQFHCPFLFYFKRKPNKFKKAIDICKIFGIIVEHLEIIHRGVEQLVARRAHNPEVASSSLVPATKKNRFLTVLYFYSKHLKAPIYKGIKLFQSEVDLN